MKKYMFQTELLLSNFCSASGRVLYCNNSITKSPLKRLKELGCKQIIFNLAWQNDNSTIQQFNNSTIQQFNNSTIQQFNNSTIQQFNNSTIQQFNNSTIQQF